MWKKKNNVEKMIGEDIRTTVFHEKKPSRIKRNEIAQ